MEDIGLDAILSSTGIGRWVDEALFFGGNNLVQGTLHAFLVTCLIGGIYMAQHRKPGHGGTDAALIYGTFVAGVILAGIYWVIMVGLATNFFTKIITKLVSKVIEHIPIIGHFAQGHLSTPQMINTFAKTEVANLLTNVWGVLVGVLCIFAGPAVAAMPDYQEPEYKARAEIFKGLGVMTMFFGIGWGALQIVIVAF